MCSDADFCVSQKSVELVSRSGPTQKDIDADEFSSFLFWRDPLPKLDSELLSLLVSPPAAGCVNIQSFSFPFYLNASSVSRHPAQDSVEDLNSTKQEKHPESSRGTAASSDADQFSTFLFWREPLPSIDDDLLEMLVSLEPVHFQKFQSTGWCRSDLGYMAFSL